MSADHKPKAPPRYSVIMTSNGSTERKDQRNISEGQLDILTTIFRMTSDKAQVHINEAWRKRESVVLDPTIMDVAETKVALAKDRMKDISRYHPTIRTTDFVVQPV